MSCSFLTVTGSEVPGDNSYKLFTAMSGAALYTDTSGDRLGFAGRSSEKVKSTHLFVRVKNQEYNFTNNQTYVTGSEGIIIDDFYQNPHIYLTEVGLYNAQNELLAVAKPSSPIYKNYTEEALLEISLRY